jgi:isopentenyl phosphate kinase
MIILKLGGSVITDKSIPFSVRTKAVERIAREVKEAGKEVIIVHGGGSFGHPIAHEYGIQDGLKDPDQIIGVAKTRLAMSELNQIIVESFVSEGLPAASIQTSAIFNCENKRISEANIDIISEFLKIGIIPVLYGDVVIDMVHKVCILSGDQIVTYLARKFSPEKVILGSDVDGVLDKKGSVIEEIDHNNKKIVLDSIGPRGGDVTGGMRGKVGELISLSDDGVSSVVINATQEGRLKNVLLGKRTIGTLFRGRS